MAAGLGFKDFVTGEVLTAADVDGYLMQGIWVFANAAARSAAVTSPQEGNYSFLKDTNSTEYYTGSAWVAAGGGGGKVLQVVAGTYSTSATNSTTTYADTGLTATITPTLATSKVLVLVNQSGIHKSDQNSNNACYITLLRGATTIITEFAGIAGLTATALNNYIGSVSASYLDEPATTSATTYKTQFKNNNNGAQVGVNSSNSTSTIVLMEIGA